MPHFAKKDEKSSIWPKLHLFQQTITFKRFAQLFSEKLQKVPHFIKKHEKSSIWPKLATFRAKHYVSAFWWTFQTKLPKNSSFCQKARKIVDLAKTCNFWSKLSHFGVFVNFSEKCFQKWLISQKTTKHRQFRQNSQLIDPNYHVLLFWSIFRQKLAKSASFREKARKIVDLVKTCNFSRKILRFGVLVNISAKSCKRCLISPERTKNRRFGQNLKLLEKTNSNP